MKVCFASNNRLLFGYTTHILRRSGFQPRYIQLSPHLDYTNSINLHFPFELECKRRNELRDYEPALIVLNRYVIL